MHAGSYVGVKLNGNDNSLNRKHMVNQRGFTLIELISVLVIMSVVASVTFQRFYLISTNAEARAIDSARGELNIRETLTWTNIKLSNAGWIDDENVFQELETFLGKEYEWKPGPDPNINGGTLFFRQNSVILTRNASTSTSAGSWQ